MSNLTPEQQALRDSWAAVYEGAGQALDWVEKTRVTAPRLDSEADALSLELHKARNQAKSLSRVATTPMTAGFFGLSQAGKSFLISALAAGPKGTLETDFGPQRMDFIEHVNPGGGGKEATGLVTRFSRLAKKSEDDNFPVELKLFNEIELAKILANTWFKDFDQEKVNYVIDEECIRKALKPFEGRETGPLQPGVNADDVVSLLDYLNKSFEKSLKALTHHYWPKVIKLAPRLNFQERGELFSILWGEQSALTRVYQQLAGSLNRLGMPATVFAPLSVLVERQGEEYSRRNSIMSVDILERFASPQDLPVEVRPFTDGRLQNPNSLPIAQLAALTAEMTFRLVETPNAKIVEQVDLLDFPGYRGRRQISSISSENGQENSVSQLILRGKVAYLFERYTDDQEMNALVVCTGSTNQSDVNDVGPVLSRWIEVTQGKTAQERAGRATGLIWALTMFDKCIAQSLQKTALQLDEEWESMMTRTMLERFKSFPWMANWKNDQAFNNTYLVRKPRMPTPFINLVGKDEQQFSDSCGEQLTLMRKTFVKAELVSKHVKDVDQAWDAMLTLNDGGITRFSESFSELAGLEFKLSRIREQLQQTLNGDTLKALSRLYRADGDDASAAKREQAQMILAQLKRRGPVLGELINTLQLPNEDIRELYLNGVYDEDDSEPADDADQVAEKKPQLYAPSSDFDFGDSFGDLSVDFDAPVAAAAEANQAPELQSNEHKFARAVFKDWIAYLRAIPGRQGLMDVLQLDKPSIEALVDELITSGYRLDLPGQLRDAVLKRAQSGSRRDQMVERQVLEVQRVLSDFVAWFGYTQKPVAERPKSHAGNREALFAFYGDVAPDQLPILPAQPANQAQQFLGDWLSGVAYITMENAGHGSGNEITPEQNERLGHVLKMFPAR